MLAREGRSFTTSSRWPFVIAVVVLLWLAAVLVTLSRPFTDHVPVAAVPPPRATTPFEYRCSAPLGGAHVELRSGQPPADAAPSRSGCEGPRRARRAVAAVDVVVVVVVIAAMATWSLRRRAHGER